MDEIMDDQNLACNSTRHFYSETGSTAAGWFYVVVTETESTGPRQPVSSWVSKDGTLAYGIAVAVAAAVLNLLLGLVMMIPSPRSQCESGDDVQSTVTSTNWRRRLLVINFAAVQLAVGVLIVPIKVATEALGVWPFGGLACRTYLLGQVLLIAETMWSAVFLVFDALHGVVKSTATTDDYAHFGRRYSCMIGAAAVTASWLAATTSLLPLGVALTGNTGIEGDDSDIILEDVCAVSMKRDDAVAQAIISCLLPAAIALTGCVAVAIRRVRHLGNPSADPIDRNEKLKLAGGDKWVPPVAVSIVCCSMWSPFFATYAALPFCPYDRMCVDPGTWTVLAWLGYTASAAGPLCWIIGDGSFRCFLKHVCHGVIDRAIGSVAGRRCPENLKFSTHSRRGQLMTESEGASGGSNWSDDV